MRLDFKRIFEDRLSGSFSFGDDKMEKIKMLQTSEYEDFDLNQQNMIKSMIKLMFNTNNVFNIFEAYVKWMKKQHLKYQ